MYAQAWAEMESQSVSGEEDFSVLTPDTCFIKVLAILN